MPASHRKHDRRALASAASALAVGAAILLAPAAHATTNAEDDYINDLTAAGIDGPADSLISDGHAMCAAMASGMDPNDLSATYYKNAGSLSHAQADLAVNDAIKDLCPGG
ncbi:DUF732 domain-containing protein [Mycolicibacterium hodleri]|uniref:DUF732 domain-containing protein n=1 Tax=Mycolicibacterium hodleri TaxID=49897 RepID=A0A502E4E5_9MYCO|nr:DUF732 domain-containing protein [Mycolicibacterium hodleri]TPG31652.1 DUF732 domain-containing protein [Mycolicibacterium hodleri]